MASSKQNVFNIKLKMLIVHGILYGIIIIFFSCAVVHNDLFSPMNLIIVGILFLVLEQIIDYFLFNKRLQVNDDEILRYKYCKTGKQCDKCHIDALLNIMFKSTPDLMSFKDPKLRYVMCSKVFMDLFGLKSEHDFVRKTPFEIFPEKQAKIISMYDNLVLKEKESKTYVVSFNINDTERYYELVSAPIISNNQVVGVLTLSREITESYNLQESLEFSNSQLYTLINNAPMLAYVTDPEGNFVLGNARAKNFFLTGTDTTFDGEKIQFDLDDLKPEFIMENKQVIREKRAMNFERCLVDRNGEGHWYINHKTPMKNKDGTIYAVTSFVRNVNTEKRRAEERETYIATLSHDLKTPAIAQVRALELLLSGQLGDFNDEQKEMLKLTLDSCNYLYDMVYTLLSTYKFENGDITLNYSSFDISTMISESIKELSNLAQENSIKITYLSENTICKISADRIELKRVIVNLLSNAINYAFSGSTVEVLLNATESNIEVKVKNAGPYIESEVMSKLFRKYVSHSEKYNKVGIGLGLYLSKKIVEAHNGKIIAESYIENQNIFGFSIPIITKNKLKESDKVEAL